MKKEDFILLMPFIIMAASIVVLMLAIAVRRSHGLAVWIALSGLAAASASLPGAASLTPRMITPLLVIDDFALYYMALIYTATFAVAGLSYAYNRIRIGDVEEYYLLLLTASLGASVLAASVHFASFFLGFEILSVSLYALAAYQRHNDRSIEAGVKYLILAAVSSSFVLFGMALMYAESGTMAFPALARNGTQSLLFVAGIVLVMVGVGFKLAVVPFHMWTPDVYEGAPAPVAAFIATVSKGSVFALALRFFPESMQGHPLFILFTIMAVASMFVGNLLALFQKNVKRILAYSSISHLGYLLVTLLVAGPARITAASFYLTAYFVTALGAFGVVTVLSGSDRDADTMEQYAGLAWRRPWLAAAFTGMLFSLAGIPLTGGFIAKFSIAAAGVHSALWFPVIMLVINSVLGIFYYLRIVAALYSTPVRDGVIMQEKSSFSGGTVIFALAVLVLWLGLYPGPVLAVIQALLPQIPK